MTFEEFWKLPFSEQKKRYQELSEHDKLLARMDGGNPTDKPREPYRPSTQEEINEIMRIFQGKDTAE